MTATPVIPVILSGGAGSRLWPLSRSSRPKQFLGLHSDKTLFQETAHEPEARSTAPAIAAAAVIALEKDPDALLMVLPSDHVIDDREGFDEAGPVAARAAPDHRGAVLRLSGRG